MYVVSILYRVLVVKEGRERTCRSNEEYDTEVVIALGSG